MADKTFQAIEHQLRWIAAIFEKNIPILKREVAASRVDFRALRADFGALRADLQAVRRNASANQKDGGGTLPSIPEQPIIIQEGGYSQEKEDLAIQESGGPSLLTQEVQEKALEDQESCGSFQEESFDKQEDRQASRICVDSDCKEKLLLKQHGPLDFLISEGQVGLEDICKQKSLVTLHLGYIFPMGTFSKGLLREWVLILLCSPTRILIFVWFQGELVRMLLGAGFLQLMDNSWEFASFRKDNKYHLYCKWWDLKSSQLFYLSSERNEV